MQFFNYLFIFVSFAVITLAAPTEKRGGFYAEATYYNPGFGSCGITSKENEDIVALNHAQMEEAAMGSNPNDNPLCGEYISIKGPEGNSKARIVDTCPGCDYGCLDLSPKVFLEVCGSLDLGHCDVSWDFV